MRFMRSVGNIGGICSALNNTLAVSVTRSEPVLVGDLLGAWCRSRCGRGVNHTLKESTHGMGGDHEHGSNTSSREGGSSTS